MQELLDAVRLLSHSPGLGHPVSAGKRELVIGNGVCGYVLLYRHVVQLDTVFVLAARAQRASGFKH